MELNICIFSGYATDTLTLKTTQSGLTVGQFSLAINEKGFTKQDGTQIKDKVHFINISVFGNYAVMLSKMIIKGTPLVCQCRLKQDIWESNGQKHNQINFIADFVKILPKSQKKEQEQNSANIPQEVQTLANLFNGEVVKQ